jgi:hypothetical protein
MPTQFLWAAPAFLALTAAGQTPSPKTPPPKPVAPAGHRAYMQNMANEDWSFLKDKSLHDDFLDPVKYIGLGREDWHMTLGGEIRIRPEGFRIRGAPGQPSFIDSYLLQRYLFGTDVHLGKRVRFYGELQSGIISGRLNSPRPTDKDLLEVHQAFFEYHSPKETPNRFRLRLGRQELTLGSSRLISASQGLNVKRSFDGLVADKRYGNWLVEGGAAKLVRINPGIFDDPPDAKQTFGGISLVRNAFLRKTIGLGGYYLLIDRKGSIYVQGTGREVRHSIGTKLSGVAGRFDFNYDLILQWGTFSDAPIRAWAISTETGYRFQLGKFRPRIALLANMATGDRDRNDPSLESFNPLFPGNSYSGQVGLLGPTNLADITPSFQFPVRRGLLLGFELPSYFRRSTADGVYSITLVPLIAGQHNQERYVGTNPGVFALWQATRHFSLAGASTRFLPGPFLKGTFVENGFGFYSVSITYRF